MSSRETGRFQHYLPAAFLGGFAFGSERSKRDRVLYVLRRGETQAFASAARRVAAENDLYTVSPAYVGDPFVIDALWSGYEARLSEGIELLVGNRDGLIPADLWARILVGFATSLLARGVDFSRRFLQRMESIPYGQSQDNVNFARAMELQRLLAPILVARWVVLHVVGDDPVITNDLGYALFQAPDHPLPGYAVPLSKDAVLGILPTGWRSIVRRSPPSGWQALIEHRDLDHGSHQQLNEVLAQSSQRFSFGASPDVVERQSGMMQGEPVVPPEPGTLGFAPNPLILVAHEFEWYRLVTALGLSPEDERLGAFTVDWGTVAAGWHPVPMLPTNLPDFPTGLRWDGRDIYLALTEVPGFTDEAHGT